MDMDKQDYRPGMVEKVTGHPVTAAGVTGFAALAAVATPAAIFLPGLSSSLVAQRQEKRFQRFVDDAIAYLNKHEEQLRDITDTQYQLINDAVVSALNTLDERKLEYLRHAISNALYKDVDPIRSASISRIVRDITAEEADFLLRAEPYKHVTLAHTEDPDTLQVDPDSRDAVAMSGLLSLGLLRTNSGWGAGGTSFTQDASIVRSLLTTPTP